MWKRIKKDKVLYLLMLPAMLYFLIFHVWPILEMRLAFYDYRIVGDNIFVGWKHFKTLFSTPAFYNIIKNTLVISFMKIVLFFPLPVAFALALNEMRTRHFRKVVQVVSYLPHFLSWVVIAGIWYEFLSPSNGLVMDIVAAFGGERVNLLTDKNSILLVLFASSTWRSMGWDSIIYLSAILGIDTALYEAARMDGASGWQSFRRITIPMLTPITFFVSIMLTISCFKVFDLIYTMTEGGPGRATNVLVMHIYQSAFTEYKFGYASAVAMVLFVMVLVITLIQFRMEKKWTGYM